MNLAILHLMLCLFSWLYFPSCPLIYLFLAFRFILLPIRGLILLIIEQPLIGLLHYASYATYPHLLTVLPICVDETLPSHAPIPIKHLPFWTHRFWCPYYFCQSPREESNFHSLLSVVIHNAVFDNSSFNLSVVHITLHILVLPFFLNTTKHGRYCRLLRNLPW